MWAISFGNPVSELQFRVFRKKEKVDDSEFPVVFVDLEKYDIEDSPSSTKIRVIEISRSEETSVIKSLMVKGYIVVADVSKFDGTVEQRESAINSLTIIVRDAGGKIYRANNETVIAVTGNVSVTKSKIRKKFEEKTDEKTEGNE